MYGNCCHINNVLPEMIFKVLSVYGHGSHIVNVFAEKSFKV